MTHTPHSNRAEAEDPLSLFAPEEPALSSDVDMPEASDVEYHAASSVDEEPFDRISVRAVAPPAPVWHRHRSSGLTFAVTVVAVTTLMTGWLLTRKTESAGTRTGVSIPETARQTPAPVSTVETPPERTRETPAGTTPRPAPPESKQPARAVAEPPKTPAAATIPRLVQPDLGGRDSVTPAARVVTPPQSSVIPVAPPASSSGTQALATTPVPAVSIPPVVETAVTTTLPAAAPPAGTLPPAVSTPVAAPPERSPVPETELARATPAPAAPAPVTIRPRRELIQSTLDAYRGAVGARNAAAVRAIWPSADVKGQTRAFESVREQTLQLEKCEISTIIGPTAVATCKGTLTYVPNVGSKTPQVQRQEYQFNLREVNEAWLIDRVVTR